jgi:signal transduction histidine kinase
MKESFFLSLRFRITIGVLLGVVLPMLAAIWFASFHAINIIRSQAQQNLELKTDILTESISRWEEMNFRVLHTISQHPRTIGINASQELSPLATIHLGKTDFAVLVDQKGQLIANFNQNLLAANQLKNFPEYPPLKTLLAGKSGAFYFADEQGMKWLSYLKKLDSGWNVVILQPESEVLEKANLFWQLAMTITAIAVLVAGSLTWILTSRLVRSIEDLTFAAERLSGGDWNQRVNIDRQDELGTLAAAFNGMAVQLQKLFSSLVAKNQEAEQARIEAVETSKAKSLFLANMSFELRNPMNAIIGCSQMLKEELLDRNYEESLDCLSLINEGSPYLSFLIENILDICKIESERINLYLETSEVSEIIYHVATNIQPLANRKSNDFTVNYPQNIGTIYTDSNKIYTCLLNLLRTANNFTEAGEITLEVSRFSRNMEDGMEKREEECSDLEKQEQESEFSDWEEWISFKVSYTGIGMNPEEIEKAFQHFTKVDESTSIRYGSGTVLGLAITKNFCRIMGGDISLESEEGKRSAFTMELPAVVAERAAS